MNEINDILNMAILYDSMALECRKSAGKILAALQQEQTAGEFMASLADMGLDPQTLNLLIGLHAGGTLASLSDE